MWSLVCLGDYRSPSLGSFKIAPVVARNGSRRSGPGQKGSAYLEKVRRAATIQSSPALTADAYPLRLDADSLYLPTHAT